MVNGSELPEWARDVISDAQRVQLQMLGITGAALVDRDFGTENQIKLWGELPEDYDLSVGLWLFAPYHSDVIAAAVWGYRVQHNARIKDWQAMSCNHPLATSTDGLIALLVEAVASGDPHLSDWLNEYAEKMEKKNA